MIIKSVQPAERNIVLGAKLIWKIFKNLDIFDQFGLAAIGLFIKKENFKNRLTIKKMNDAEYQVMF
jgi:hypothetical protein